MLWSSETQWPDAGPLLLFIPSQREASGPFSPRSAVSVQVRVMFEVQDLKYATLATVSRCGMVWFSEDVLSTDMIFNNFLARIRSIPLDEGEDEAQRKRKGTEDEEEASSPMLQVIKRG